MICRRATYFPDSEMIEHYQKTCSWNSKSKKTKKYVTNCARYIPKKSFLKVYVRMHDCYENIKIKSDLQLAY